MEGRQIKKIKIQNSNFIFLERLKSSGRLSRKSTNKTIWPYLDSSILSYGLPVVYLYVKMHNVELALYCKNSRLINTWLILWWGDNHKFDILIEMGSYLVYMVITISIHDAAFSSG